MALGMNFAVFSLVTLLTSATGISVCIGKILGYKQPVTAADLSERTHLGNISKHIRMKRKVIVRNVQMAL